MEEKSSVKKGTKTEIAPRASSEVAETKPKVKALTKVKAAETAQAPVQNKEVKIPAMAEYDNVKHVLFVCGEANPFAGTGGLCEVMGSLPAEINKIKQNVEARVIMPLYESVSAEARKSLKFVCHINIPLSWRNQYCGLYTGEANGVTYYFIDNEYYFKRPNLYGYYDDGERFAFFSRAVVELLPYLNWRVDILHSQDWQAALVPIYYKLFYMFKDGYGGVKNIFTIHNIEYQGKYSKSIIEDIFGIPVREYISIEHNGCINLMKGAIDYADAISTVSPNYAKEIMTPFYAHGLENILIKNAYKLRGILNGIDLESYNPETNKSLFQNYSVEKPDGKAVNKLELQKMLNLPMRADVPVIAVISRLVAHKGLDLVRAALNSILMSDVQVVILGKGDPDYEGYFTHMESMYDQKVRAIIAYNKDLSHKIYSGADMFLMPSKSEPCGLSQMMAARYGTVPIVRLTGGLKDSIADCGDGDYGNGFTFYAYDFNDMLRAVDRAIGLYKDYPEKWCSLVQRAMNTDFSWGSSAKEYIKFYNEI